jgi:hypothetical protein
MPGTGFDTTLYVPSTRRATYSSSHLVNSLTTAWCTPTAAVVVAAAADVVPPDESLSLAVAAEPALGGIGSVGSGFGNTGVGGELLSNSMEHDLQPERTDDTTGDVS